MFSLYSKRCEYALRALIWVAMHRQEGRFQAAEVCREVGVPEFYSRKVFQDLTQGAFLTAVRGPGGGYALTRPADEIGILDVIHAVDGPDIYANCVMGLPECGKDEPCPLHNTWSEAKKRLIEELSVKTLWDLANSLPEGRTRSSPRRKGQA